MLKTLEKLSLIPLRIPLQAFIRTKYCFLLAVVVSSLLACYASYSFLQRYLRLESWKKSLHYIRAEAPQITRFKAECQELVAQIEKADGQYLQNYLSSQSFLRKERYRLISLAENHTLSPLQKERLRFLTDGQNSLQWTPGKKVKTPLWRYVEFKQTHSVEVDEEDIQKILAHIEGISIGPYCPNSGRPPMTIKQCELIRHDERPVFFMNLDLWSKEIFD